MEVTGSKSAGFTHEAVWSFTAEGAIIVENKSLPHGDFPHNIPRIGLSLVLDPALERMAYYGRGPRENYIDRCKSSPRGAKFDAELARATIEKVAPRIYDDPKLTPQAKFKAVDRHCTLLCDQKRFDDALEIAKRYTEMKDAKGKGWARSCVALKNVYRLMDRYPDALTALKRGIAAAPQKGDLCAEAAKLALEFGDVKSVPAIWALDTDSNAEYKTMSWVLENKDALDEVAAFRDATLKGVLPFLSNVKNPANQRLWLACRAGLVADTPEGAAARKAVGDVLASGKASLDWGVVHKLR